MGTVEVGGNYRTVALGEAAFLHFLSYEYKLEIKPRTGKRHQACWTFGVDETLLLEARNYEDGLAHVEPREYFDLYQSLKNEMIEALREVEGERPSREARGQTSEQAA